MEAYLAGEGDPKRLATKTGVNRSLVDYRLKKQLTDAVSVERLYTRVGSANARHK